MEREEYFLMSKQEESHWWYKGMWEIVDYLIKKNLNRHNLSILDIGSGTGINLRKLEKYGKPSGIDYSNTALSLCRKRGLKKIYKATVEKLPFKDNSFDLITCFEVLYHKNVKNDDKALKEIHRVCKINGYVILREPAFRILFGDHDIRVHGNKRYNKKILENKLKKAGFKIEKISYLNISWFFPILLVRTYQRIRGLKKKSDINTHNILLNKILYKILSFEKFFINNYSLPFGVSIICIARK